VAQSRQANQSTKKGTQRQVSSRSKRADIVTTAANLFGEQGYEYSKWSDVAAAVGIGSTALYHYFESKLHCLYVIMAEALESFQANFERITKDHDDYLAALVEAIRSGYDLTDAEVLRMRVLVAEQGLVGVRRPSPREEEARQLARARTRDLEFAWATFLVRGMEQGLLPEADPRLLTRALLGLNTSVWHWYRPRGGLALEDVADFFVRRQLAVLGLSPELADQVTSSQLLEATESPAPAPSARSGRRPGRRRP
jgi:AcrR family transcriptional regulator